MATRDPAEVAQEILVRARLMQVSTADLSSKPWPFACWFAPDGWDLIFLSKDFRRHSQNILANSQVSANVIGLANTLGDPVQQVTVEGVCAQVKDGSIESALILMTGRYPRISATASELIDPEVPDFLWRIRTTSVVLFDELNFGAPVDPRIEVI